MTFLERKLSFLGTKTGRIALFICQLLFLFVAIWSLYTTRATSEALELYGNYTMESGLFETLLIIFLFERLPVFGLIWWYGLHPNRQYEEYALQQIEKDTLPQNEEQAEESEQNTAKFDIETLSKRPAADNEKLMCKESIKLIFTHSDNKLLDGIKSLWYGALFSTTDYTAQIYKYQQFPEVTLTLFFYAFCIAFLFIMTSYWLIAVMKKYMIEIMGGMDIFATPTNNNTDPPGDVTTDAPGDFEFTWFDALMLFLNMLIKQVKLVKHAISFGTLLYKKDNKVTIMVKWVSYIGSGCCCCCMMFNVIVLIAMLYFAANWDEYI